MFYLYLKDGAVILAMGPRVQLFVAAATVITAIGVFSAAIVLGLASVRNGDTALIPLKFKSKWGKYETAAVATDAGICSTVGRWVAIHC